MKQKLIALLGTWAKPPDFPSKVALGIAVVFALAMLIGRGRNLLGFDIVLESPHDAHVHRRRFVLIASLAAALFSIAYVSNYLHGGPRIIDATTYFLQGRALSHGHFSWEPLEPSASFRGRFLDFDVSSRANATLGGIFPPGYPLLLSFGFMLGSPLIVGPLLAAAIVGATHKLARAVAIDAFGEDSHLVDPISRTAALISVLCAALRYHTADTMSHGAAALGITLALAYAIEARRDAKKEAEAREEGREEGREEDRSPFDQGRGASLASGLALGYVAATRPASAVPIALVVAWLLGRRRIAFVLIGVVPGLFLLALSQKAVTGSWLESTQRMYYATSDGPPGCYRFGFGKNTGCVFEHGDYVRDRLPNGYFGALEAAGTTLRRLRKHLLDVANFEPLALLALVPPFVRTRFQSSAVVRAIAVLVLLQILAYVPFYFDGDYPGGGARFFADVLPIEHVLVALSLAWFASKATAAADDDDDDVHVHKRLARLSLGMVAVMASGFAIHASHEHVLLRDRDGGHPYFEPDILSRQNVSTGLVFIDSDHGFALAHDPSVHSTKNGLVVARLRNDDRDRILFDSLERPPTWLYKLAPPVPPSTEAIPSLTPWAPPETAAWSRFEGEAEWPPLSQENGITTPSFVDACASGTRALVVVPTAAGAVATTTIEIPITVAGRYWIEPHLVHGVKVPHATITATPKPQQKITMNGVEWPIDPKPSGCVALDQRKIEATPPRAKLVLETTDAVLGLDYVSVKVAP